MSTFSTRVGIDLAKRAKHKAVVVGDGVLGPGVSAKALSFSHDAAGFAALLDHILAHTGGESLDGVLVNMEPTGNVFEPLAGFLRAHGAEACFTRLDVVSALRKAHSRFAKSDRIDAETLAQVPVSFPNRLVPVVGQEPRLRRLRDLAAQRHRLVEDATKWKNRLMAKLEAAWNPLFVLLKPEQRFSVFALKFFKRFTNPRQVVRLGQERFARWCRDNAHGLTSPDLFGVFWRGSVTTVEFVETLECCGAFAFDWENLKELVAQDLRMIANLEKEIKRVDKRIAECRKDAPECDVAAQLPGVGKVVAVTLATALAPATRFSSAKKCGAYTGFTSRKKGSGDREIEGLKITKSGNRRLKRDLALAADTAMTVDAELAAFAIGLLKAGKHYNKVRVAVGRKLAVRAYSLIKRYEAGDTSVTYVWRDPEGNQITRKQARALAGELWAVYKAGKKGKGR